MDDPLVVDVDGWLALAACLVAGIVLSAVWTRIERVGASLWRRTIASRSGAATRQSRAWPISADSRSAEVSSASTTSRSAESSRVEGPVTARTETG